MNNRRGINYGNWVSASMMRLWIAITLIFTILCITSFSYFTTIWPASVQWGIRGILIVLTMGSLLVTIYFFICRCLFSYKGKSKIQSKILDYVLSYIKFDYGQILDIGCGNGAFAIKVAKKFPNSIVTGVDYWGTVWNFAKEQCGTNAKLEGVSNQITFQKGDAANLEFPDEYFDGAISNFVFHEVNSQPDKQQVVREALRVVKKGGFFAFHDLFFEEKFYGNIGNFVEQLKSEGIREIHLVYSKDEKFIPRILKTRFMLGRIGLIYGIK